MKRLCAVLSVLLCAGLLTAGEWRGLTDENRYAGKKLTARDMRRKIVLVEEWGVDCPTCIETLPFIEKCWRGYSDHPFILVASHRQTKDVTRVKAALAAANVTCPVYQDVEFSDAPAGNGLPFFYVIDASGKVIYAGSDKNESVAAVANAITDLPIPGQLIEGVRLKKFRQMKGRLVMGRSAEGAILAPLKEGLKSSKPEVVEEARTILDAVAAAKTHLEEEIADELGPDGDKGLALRDLRWFMATWPSGREKYADAFKRLAADPEAVKGEKAYFASLKNRDGRKRR